LTENRLDLQTPEFHPVQQGNGTWRFQRDHEAWAWQDNIFSDGEIEAIRRLGEKMTLDRAKTTGNDGDDIRKSQTSWIFPSPYSGWIFARLTDVVLEMNRRYFGFDLSAFEQGLQFTRYEGDGSHYTWHMDRGSDCGVRKLSIVVQLSDPSEYEGGHLEMLYGATPFQIERAKSRAVVFPSWALHRVEPVTSGRRESLVGWISGPLFR